MNTSKGSRNRWAAGIALVSLLSVADASAQQQRVVARLKQVTGNVLVSRDAGLATGSEAQPLVNGTRIITTANSTAIVRFDDGCEVELKENQRLEIDSSKPCAAMLAQAVGPAPVAAVAPIMGTVFPVLVGVIIALDEFEQAGVVRVNQTSVSPN